MLAGEDGLEVRFRDQAKFALQDGARRFEARVRRRGREGHGAAFDVRRRTGLGYRQRR